MKERPALVWAPWGAEPHAFFARSSSGTETYVARRREDGSYALYVGGQFVKLCACELDCRREAEAIELSRSTKGKYT